MVGSRAIELGAVWHAPLDKGQRPAEVEGRLAHRHGDDPGARRRIAGGAGYDVEHVADRSRRRQRGAQRLQSFPLHVRMRIDDARNDRAAFEIDHLGCRPGEGGEIAGGADGQDAAAADGDGLGRAAGRVHGEDGAARQQHVGMAPLGLRFHR